MQYVSHPGDDTDRLDKSRKEEGRGSTSIEDSVDTSIRLEDDGKKRALNDYSYQPDTKTTTKESTEEQ